MNSKEKNKRLSLALRKNLKKRKIFQKKIKRRLRNIINDAVKKMLINFNFSFLVIAKSTVLNSEFKNIKETLFQEFRNIK